MMKVSRRKFMKLFGAAPIAAAVPSLVTAAKPVYNSTVHRKVGDPFGLAPIKSEGGTLNYDSFSKALWPGINKWYGEAYKNVDLTKLYG